MNVLPRKEHVKEQVKVRLIQEGDLQGSQGQPVPQNVSHRLGLGFLFLNGGKHLLSIPQLAPGQSDGVELQSVLASALEGSVAVPPEGIMNREQVFPIRKHNKPMLSQLHQAYLPLWTAHLLEQ